MYKFKSISKQPLVGLALAVSLLPPTGAAQMTGPHVVNLDPMHTTQPICDGDKNDGIDISVPVGTPVISPADGVIDARWNDKTYGCGLTVMMKFPDGSYAGFAWLSDTRVEVGQKVKQGEIIAHSGQTGNAPSPELHYTVFTPGGEKIDPRKWVQPKQAESTQMFTDPAALQRALDALAVSDDPDYLKKRERSYIIEKFHKDRALAAAIYKDDLDKAVNSWYASNKDWRKIPSDVWAKLSDADKGRFRNGIDPETIVRR